MTIFVGYCLHHIEALKDDDYFLIMSDIILMLREGFDCSKMKNIKLSKMSSLYNALSNDCYISAKRLNHSIDVIKDNFFTIDDNTT